jgi:hypothetical protein
MNPSYSPLFRRISGEPVPLARMRLSFRIRQIQVRLRSSSNSRRAGSRRSAVGPFLKDEDLAALQSAIELELLPAPLSVGTEVLFATLPVNGAFRYEDVFQILPVPSEAPRPSVLIADHPFLLQFKYKSSQNAFLRAARRAAQARRLKLLLSVLLEGGVRGAGSFSRHHWVIPPFDPAPALPLRSTWCQEVYTFESLGTVAGSTVFGDIASTESLPLIDPVDITPASEFNRARPSAFRRSCRNFSRASSADRATIRSAS